MRRGCPVQAKTAEHGDHVERAVTAMKASRSRAATTGLPITCCSIATAHRTGRSVRSGSCMTGPFSRRIVELVRTPVILAGGLGPEECRRRYPRGALVDG